MFERLQARQIADDRGVFERVLQNAVAAGRLSSEVLAGVEIQIEIAERHGMRRERARYDAGEQNE